MRRARARVYTLATRGAHILALATRAPRSFLARIALFVRDSEDAFFLCCSRATTLELNGESRFSSFDSVDSAVVDENFVYIRWRASAI